MMRRSVKVLANFLGAAKELTGEYVQLAEITEDELDQLRRGILDRERRKPTVKMLAAKGLSTREIAGLTGWSHNTIAKELRVTNVTKSVTKETAKPAATGSVKTKAHREEVAAVADEGGITDEPVEKYRIIYADPPWSYGNTQPDYHTEQRDHYPVMELEEICALPVSQWVEDNAVLFLWVTSPILEEAFDVVRAWGFKYKASFVWDKIKHNMGHYNSVRHELLLICVHGSCQPDTQERIDSVQSIERSNKHSEKPVEFYDIIETLYTHGRKLLLFGREQRDGWDVYGHLAHMDEAAE